MGLASHACPVVAATHLSSANALGYPKKRDNKYLCCRLATSVIDYHYSFELGGKKKALEAFHKIMLELQGHLTDKTYHQHISEAEIQPSTWRSQAIGLLKALRYDPERYNTADAWLEHARCLLAPLLSPNGRTIKQRLSSRPDLADSLFSSSPNGHCARSIHSVKGMQFPAICVVMSPKTTKAIIDYLDTGSPEASSEEARKIYVGASRAQILLTIAVPKSQVSRLESFLRATGAYTDSIDLGA